MIQTALACGLALALARPPEIRQSPATQRRQVYLWIGWHNLEGR